MYILYLTESDMLDDAHFPVIALFNEALNDNIKRFYMNLSEGVGCGYNYSVCFFWNELDEYDRLHTDHFNGICVETEDEESVVISYAQMLSYMKLAYSRYCKKNGNKSETIEDLIKKFQNKYVKSDHE